MPAARAGRMHGIGGEAERGTSRVAACPHERNMETMTRSNLLRAGTSRAPVVVQDAPAVRRTAAGHCLVPHPMACCYLK